MSPASVSTAFRRALAWEPLGDGTWRGTLDATWSQGRATFGGLQAALLVQAMQARVHPDRPLRSLHVAFSGPLAPGPAELASRVERAGGSLTVATARIVQEGVSRTVGTGTFGRPRAHGVILADPPLPERPRPPRAVQMPALPGMPAFTRYAYIDLLRGMPFGGADRAEIAGWGRFVEPEPADAPLLAAIADLWPPAILAVVDRPRPSASADMTVQFLHPPPLSVPDDALYAFEARSTAVADGYAEERGKVWDPSGRLVMRIRQLRVVY